MTSSSEHWEVASYVLGVLDEEDVPRFEAHLAGCYRCAEELEELLPLAAMLSDVDPAELGQERPEPLDDRMLTRMVSVVSRERDRTRGRRVLALAAVTVGMVVLVGLSFVTGRQSSGGAPEGTAAQPPATATGAAPTQPAASTGPQQPDGRRIGTTDPTSQMHVELVLAEKGWGTEVSVSVANISGPLVRCELVAVGRGGSAEVVASWSVPPEGYGRPGHPAPLLLQGSTVTPADTLDRFEVRSVQPGGPAVTLATVRL